KIKIGISTGRASELMQIADGRKTLAELRAEKNETSKAAHTKERSSLNSEEDAETSDEGGEHRRASAAAATPASQCRTWRRRLRSLPPPCKRWRRVSARVYSTASSVRLAWSLAQPQQRRGTGAAAGSSMMGDEVSLAFPALTRARATAWRAPSPLRRK